LIKCLLPLLSAQLTQVQNTLGVSPLVIVPSNNLDHILTHNHGKSGINSGRHVGHSVIARDKGLIRDSQHSLHGTISGLAEGSVDLLGHGLLLDLYDEIDDRDGGGGDTESDTIELALHVGEDKSDSLGGTGGGGHNVEGGSASTAEIAVRGIKETLVTSVGVSGGHGSLDNSELLVNNLDEGGKAVGGARSIGDDLVRVLVLVSIDTDDVGGDVISLGGGSDEDLLGTSFKMLGGTLGVNEDTGTLNDEIDVHGGPGELEGVAGRDDGDGLTVDSEGGVTGDLDISIEGSHGGIVLEQVRGLLDTARVVDADNLDVGVGTALPAAEELATNTAETVDSNLDLLGGDGYLAGTGTRLHVGRK
jgi:hypothetical protein